MPETATGPDAGGGQRPDGGLRLGTLLAALTAALTLGGLFASFVLNVASERFYHHLGLFQDDVGLSWPSLLPRSIGLVAVAGTYFLLALGLGALAYRATDFLLSAYAKLRDRGYGELAVVVGVVVGVVFGFPCTVFMLLPFLLPMKSSGAWIAIVAAGVFVAVARGWRRQPLPRRGDSVLRWMRAFFPAYVVSGIVSLAVAGWLGAMKLADEAAQEVRAGTAVSRVTYLGIPVLPWRATVARATGTQTYRDMCLLYLGSSSESWVWSVDLNHALLLPAGTAFELDGDAKRCIHCRPPTARPRHAAHKPAALLCGSGSTP